MSRLLLLTGPFVNALLSFFLVDFAIGSFPMAGVLSFLLLVILSSLVSVVSFFLVFLGLLISVFSEGQRNNFNLRGLNFLCYFLLFNFFFHCLFFFLCVSLLKRSGVDFDFIKICNQVFQQRNLFFIFWVDFGKALGN